MNDTPLSYVAEPTPGTCVLCPDPEHARVAHYPPVCDACRSWLSGTIGDTRILAEQLAEPEAQVRDVRVAPVRGKGGYAVRDDHGGLVLRWRDPVANAQPAGPVSTRRRESRVSGTHGAPVPANLTTVDLIRPAWYGSRGPYTRGLLGKDEDQVGDLALATVLEDWVREWRRARSRGEGMPDLTVEAMTRWLASRVQWACDDYPEVRAFADDIQLYRSIMRRMLGMSERPEYKFGVACPKCTQRNLFRKIGSDWVECGSCPAIMSPAEYQTHIGETAVSGNTPAEAA